MLRVVDELVWTLRRSGLSVSTAQAIDVARATALVGFADREALRAAIGAIVVHRSDERRRYADAFDRFFHDGPPAPEDLFERLAARGFSSEEIAAAMAIFEAAATTVTDAPGLAALRFATTELEALFREARSERVLAGLAGPAQAGFFAHRLGERLGLPALGPALARLRLALTGALGPERGGDLADALADEAERLRRSLRAHVESLARRRADVAAPADSAMDEPFAELDDEATAEVRSALRALAERLRGSARVRRRRARRGRLDVRTTLRRSFATGGVPIRPARRARRRDKPRLVVLCDVSASVRPAARFLLELVSAMTDLFSETRSFAFVGDVVETTSLFADRPLGAALALVAAGGVVPGGGESNYGRALAAFEARHRGELDRRTTILVLGDGRANYRPEGAEVVALLRERARSLYWICTEGRESWTGDSAMARYEAAGARVLVARTGRELEAAAREVVADRK